MTTDDTLVTSDNHALLLIDHQYLQLLAVRSHSNDTIVNNTVMLAKGAKIFGVPTLFTTAFAERQDLIKQIQAVHPDHVPIDRTSLNSWDDERVRDWVQATAKKKLVMAGLWTEVCLTMPVLSAIAAGHEVYMVTDASGGGSVEGHERAVQRMMQAGARASAHRRLLCQRAPARLGPDGDGRRRRQSVRRVGWRIRTGAPLGVAVAGSQRRHSLSPAARQGSRPLPVALARSTSSG